MNYNLIIGTRVHHSMEKLAFFGAIISMKQINILGTRVLQHTE